MRGGVDHEVLDEIYILLQLPRPKNLPLKLLKKNGRNKRMTDDEMKLNIKRQLEAWKRCDGHEFSDYELEMCKPTSTPTTAQDARNLINLEPEDGIH